MLRTISALSAACIVSGAVAMMTGCGSSSTPVSTPPASPCASTSQPTGSTTPAQSVAFTGKVLAGGHAVSGASVQLYAASTSGYASTASSLLSAAVTTDASGAFTIGATQYACSSGAAQLYLVATGSGANSALQFVTAVGSCGSIVANSSFMMNEVTTAGFVWALAPFMGSSASVGTSATNAAGMQNAFALAVKLVDPATGVSPAAAISPQLKVASAKIYSLANSMAACSAASSNCATLFSAATYGSNAPSTTAAAALAVVKHPGQNVASIYQAAPANPPYAGLSAAPNDWTLSVESTGGGLNDPTGLAIDSTGQVWVASYQGALSAYSPQGVAVFSAPITGSGLQSIYAVAVDSSDNVWTGNDGSDSLTKLAHDGTVLSGAAGFTSKIEDPYALEGDTNGNMWVVNYGNSSLVEVSSNGTALLGPLQGSTEFPSAIALDAQGTPWISGQDGTVTHYSTSGQVLATTHCCNYSTGMAIDSSGTIWVSDFYLPGVDRLDSKTGSAIGDTKSSGGLGTPNWIALDGAGTAWLPNFHGNSFSEVAGTASGQAGAAISPSGGFGLDDKLSAPFNVAADASGTLWLTSLYDDRLVRYVGLAAPTRTPMLCPAALP